MKRSSGDQSEPSPPLLSLSFLEGLSERFHLIASEDTPQAVLDDFGTALENSLFHELVQGIYVDLGQG